MQRTVCIRFDPTVDQKAILTATRSASRDCFNAVAAWGWQRREKNGVASHRATYAALRAAHPDVPSQFVISARMKATEALRAAFALQKRGRTTTASHWECGMVRYAAGSFRVEKDQSMLGLATVADRIKLPFCPHRQARRWLGSACSFASADLLRRPSGWWVYLIVDVEPREFVPNGRVVGVDLGINRPAVTSGAQCLGKTQWKEIEQRYFRPSRKLQSKGTKSARRHVKQPSGRWRRFRKDCDHVLAKRIVAGAGPGSVIVVENLTEIRTRTTQRGRRQRRRHHSWSYAQLRGFVGDKAEAAGAIVVAIDPRHTSQRCTRSGLVHRHNRPTQSRFWCQACGCEVNADLNAARNVAWKYLASRSMSAAGRPFVNQPIVGEECAHLPAHKPPSGGGS